MKYSTYCSKKRKYKYLMKNIIFFIFISISFSQSNEVVIELVNGNQISGVIITENNELIILKSELGDIHILKSEILEIRDVSNSSISLSKRTSGGWQSVPHQSSQSYSDLRNL